MTVDNLIDRSDCFVALKTLDISQGSEFEVWWDLY